MSEGDLYERTDVINFMKHIMMKKCLRDVLNATFFGCLALFKPNVECVALRHGGGKARTAEKKTTVYQIVSL
jgi:hypothetical protein